MMLLDKDAVKKYAPSWTVPCLRSVWRKYNSLKANRAKHNHGVVAAGSCADFSQLPCPVCRSSDWPGEEDRIVEALAEILGKQRIRLWRLPNEKSPRFAFDRRALEEVENAIETVKNEGLSFRREYAKPKNNLYEFNQVDALPPDEMVSFYVYPSPHLGIQNNYLKSRGVLFEAVDFQDDVVLVPRSGLGSRVYSRELFEKNIYYRGSPAQDETWPFPIDLVVTWVDKNDDIWKQQYSEVAHEAEASKGIPAAVNAARWHSRDEIKYCLRSVLMYAPFVRNIFIVTNGQKPRWLANCDKVRVVSHEQLYPDVNVLPTFNSNHIETVLHRIDGLSEHFIYLNDDFFFSSKCKPSDFFTVGGLGKVFFSGRHLERREVTDYDRATVAAHKNTRDVIERRFPVDASRKFKHAPYVMRRSVWHEIENKFGRELEETRKNRFRSTNDINGQFLYAHYSLASGYSYAGNISYSYFDVQDDDMYKKMSRIDQDGIKVFCMNDANADNDEVDRRDDFIKEYLARRFPVSPDWEIEGEKVNNAITGVSHGSVFDEESYEDEVRQLGPGNAKESYLKEYEKTKSIEIKNKLVRILIGVGDLDGAVGVVKKSSKNGDEADLKIIEILSKDPLFKLKDLVGNIPKNKKMSKKAISLLGKTVESKSDLEILEGLVQEMSPDWKGNPALLRFFGAASRRAEEPKKAIKYLEKSLLIQRKSSEDIDTRRDQQRMRNPRSVLVDLYDALGSLGDDVFLDAGTLLGCFRDNDFIPHDYDIDVSVRSKEKFFQIGLALRKDWRFSLSRVRTPECIIQGKHITGNNFDIFLHEREGDGWIKKSHVYGWKFDDYSLREWEFVGLKVKIPWPTEHYLRQMYGESWRIPIPGFDSRIMAPNNFFPNKDEIICTCLNKASVAAKYGDVEMIMRNKEFLQKKFLYSMPTPDWVDSLNSKVTHE